MIGARLRTLPTHLAAQFVVAAVMLLGVESLEAAGELPSRSVDLNNGLLTIEAQGRPWGEVLDDLRRVTGISVQLQFQPAGSVSCSFTNLPVEHALRRLFGLHRHYVFDYETASAPLPRVVWVMVSGVAQGSDIGGALDGAFLSQIATPGAMAAAATGNTNTDDPLGNALLMADGEPLAAMRAIFGALRSSDPLTRAAAAEAIGDLQPGTELKELQALLATDPYPEVQVAAAVALAKLGSPQALGAVRNALKSMNAIVRGQILQALDQGGGDPLILRARE